MNKQDRPQVLPPQCYCFRHQFALESLIHTQRPPFHRTLPNGYQDIWVRSNLLHPPSNLSPTPASSYHTCWICWLLTPYIFSHSPCTWNTTTFTSNALFLSSCFTTISFILAQTSTLHIQCDNAKHRLTYDDTRTLLMPNDNHTFGLLINYNLGPSVLASEAIPKNEGNGRVVDESHVRFGLRRKHTEAEGFLRRRI